MPSRIELLDVGLVIPCYRESARLPRFLEALCQAMAESGIPHCIVPVDDGSGPREQVALTNVVNALRDRFPGLREPLFLGRNTGKGGAVYAGWDRLADEARFLAFVDADGSVSACEVVRLLTAATHSRSTHCLWLASRVKMLGRSIERRLIRHVAGRILATCTTLLTGIAVYDSQCGCKVIGADLFRTVRSQLDENRFAFDIDLLAMVLGSGADAVEIPVDWADCEGSKVRLVRDGLQMLGALIRIRAKLPAGKAR